MPALRMKTKEITRLSEGHGLGVCYKSPKASKVSTCCHFKESKKACILDNIQGSPQDAVTSQFESPDRSGKLTEEVELRDPHCGQSEAKSDLSLESLDTVHLGSQPVSIPETIFSPIIEPSESIAFPTSGRDSGLYDVHADLPCLIDDDDNDCCSTIYHRSLELSDYITSDFDPIVPFVGGIGFSDLINIDFPEYDHVSSGLTFDIDHKCMVFPSSGKNLDNLHDGSNNNMLVTGDESVLYLAIPQQKQLRQRAESGFCIEDVREFDCFDPHLFISTLPDTSEAISPAQSVILPREISNAKPVTLVLDLDETLVHSSLEPCVGADFSLSVVFNNEERTVYVKQRPHLHIFLERVAQMFEVVIFTASQSIYAAQLLDKLDPNNKLISKRMYRESCTFSGGNYTKDLTILGVDLEKVAIIDNSPQVFQLQVNNGIPIKSWFDDPTDCALISLLPFLETLVDAADVRPLITKFNNEQ